MILIRPRAWWYNKVPLSVLMFLLLIDGRPFTFAAVVAFLSLIGVVCCVANYGYALNELFDIDEDLRGGRGNVATKMTTRAMWAIIFLSAIGALCLATASAGAAGSLLTAGELLLPLAYSVPPVRVKERGWLGICADATAAHVYPAMIALMIVSYQSLRLPPLTLVITVALWSFGTGLRGILSHQLQSEAHDRAAGLSTVVHLLGHARLESFVVFAILPIEVMSFSALLMQSDATPFLKVLACIFVLYELLKYRLNVFPVVVFTPKGQDYIPFVDEGFYKVWGPLILSIDAAFSDPRYLVVAPLYVFLFWARVMGEWSQISLTAQSSFVRIRKAVTRLRN